jgi:hypothetical protein
MLTASRQTPQMRMSLLELGVADFEKVLEIRDREKSFAAGSVGSPNWNDQEIRSLGSRSVAAPTSL